MLDFLSLQILPKLVPRGSSDNTSAFVQVMACRLFGAKPLPEPDADTVHRRIYAPSGGSQQRFYQNTTMNAFMHLAF